VNESIKRAIAEAVGEDGTIIHNDDAQRFEVRITAAPEAVHIFPATVGQIVRDLIAAIAPPSVEPGGIGIAMSDADVLVIVDYPDA
jgi:hypothetical protein